MKPTCARNTSRFVSTFFTVSVAVAALGFSSPGWAGPAEDVIGRWKLVSHMVSAGGQSFDSHAALLQQRPCAAAIVYEVNADKSFRLNASASSCDEKYKKAQERLYAETKWRLEGNRITTSSTNFAVGQTYTVEVAGNRMTWVGTEGQGTMVFQK